jgi:hypothetical protein
VQPVASFKGRDESAVLVRQRWARQLPALILAATRYPWYMQCISGKQLPIQCDLAADILLCCGGLIWRLTCNFAEVY